MKAYLIMCKLYLTKHCNVKTEGAFHSISILSVVICSQENIALKHPVINEKIHSIFKSHRVGEMLQQKNQVPFKVIVLGILTIRYEVGIGNKQTSSAKSWCLFIMLEVHQSGNV